MTAMAKIINSRMYVKSQQYNQSLSQNGLELKYWEKKAYKISWIDLVLRKF